MISIDANVAQEVIRMLNNYTEELDVALDKWCDDDNGMKWIEGEIANVDHVINLIQNKIGQTVK